MVMDDPVPFGSQAWFLTLGLLLFARGMDFLSTWVATPNLLLEANPVARRLGWKWGSLLNLAICFAVAFWPVPAIVVATTSLLVAARNFKSAWAMRALGEHQYRFWFSSVMAQTSLGLYLLCLFGETLLTALVGLAVMFFGQDHEALLAIGMGIVGYALAVLFFTLLSMWRAWRR
jgi:hypothetical protein